MKPTARDRILASAYRRGRLDDEIFQPVTSGESCSVCHQPIQAPTLPDDETTPHRTFEGVFCGKCFNHRYSLTRESVPTCVKCLQPFSLGQIQAEEIHLVQGGLMCSDCYYEDLSEVVE